MCEDKKKINNKKEWKICTYSEIQPKKKPEKSPKDIFKNIIKTTKKKEGKEN